MHPGLGTADALEDLSWLAEPCAAKQRAWVRPSVDSKWMLSQVIGPERPEFVNDLMRGWDRRNWRMTVYTRRDGSPAYLLSDSSYIFL